jgi:hypothetical protein
VLFLGQDNPDGATYKWIISGMAGFILMLVLWVKSLLKENKDETNARMKDLEMQAAKIRHRRGKEESDV